MSNTNNYLTMQKNFYEEEASKWSVENRDPVVGSYDAHNAWEDYDIYLFKNFDTTNLIALEYGCGPGRNLVRFDTRFRRIDGTDISQTNLDKAQENLTANNIKGNKLLLCDGSSIPTKARTYDVVFSTICLQHICCHSIRYDIMKDVYRVLKKGGHFCFQMGFGGRSGTISNYFDNNTDATETNGGWDVAVTDENDLRKDLEEIGFTDYQSDIRPTGPGDTHANWIFVQVQK